MLRLLLISSSTVHGSGYLDHCEAQLRVLFEGGRDLVFIPYARPGGLTHDAYTERARARFEAMGFRLRGLHETDAPQQALTEADGVFTGGGNTFVLLAELYRTDVLAPLRERIRGGMPYAGTSAGANVAGLTIGTTNDMPIVYPPSFDALGAVPFNINPHYLDPDPASTHKGETRETRIREFHVFNAQPVLGLREGSMVQVLGDRAILEGTAGARLFRAGAEPVEYDPGADLSALLHVPATPPAEAPPAGPPRSRH